MNSSLAYSEVYEILNLLEDEYIEKIPQKVRDFFKEEKDIEYKPIIDINIPLNEQNLKRETFVLLAMLNLNYWCNNEEEKEDFLSVLAQNEKEKKELEEKYNPDNLFKNRTKTNTCDDSQQSLEMIEYKKQNFIQVLLNKIVKFFKRGK